ncbi:eukaryotic translation initiation factor 4E, partial [Trifolium medium]|nr:eukaryotic translation initiation factor 4E [Trifolium medium]
MAVEETPKSIITDDQIPSNPNNEEINNNNDLEEGEILDEGDDSSATSNPNSAVVHPLENSWTFWFDNPQAKSK